MCRTYQLKICVVVFCVLLVRGVNQRFICSVCLRVLSVAVHHSRGWNGHLVLLAAVRKNTLQPRRLTEILFQI